MTRENRYKKLADAITAFHFIWTFVLWGGMVLALRKPSYAPFEIALLTLTLVSTIPFRGICPFTLLEEKYRKKLEPNYTNHRSFTTTYANKIFKTNFDAREVNTAITILYVVSYSLLVLVMIR